MKEQKVGGKESRETPSSLLKYRCWVLGGPPQEAVGRGDMLTAVKCLRSFRDSGLQATVLQPHWIYLVSRQ